MVLVVGMAVVVARGGRGGFAGGKHGPGSGSGSSWQGSVAFWAPPQGFGPPGMPAAPFFSSWVLHGPTWPWASSGCEGHGRAGEGAGRARRVLPLQ